MFVFILDEWRERKQPPPIISFSPTFYCIAGCPRLLENREHAQGLFQFTYIRYSGLYQMFDYLAVLVLSTFHRLVIQTLKSEFEIIKKKVWKRFIYTHTSHIHIIHIQITARTTYYTP